MKKFIIHNIKIQDFRGVCNLELTHDERGVLVIVGDNESGKSTILEAFLLLLTEKTSTKKQAVKNFKPQGRDVGPTIEAELTLGENRLRIKKTFLKNRVTELSILSPRLENLTGDNAHSRFEDLVNANMDEKLRNALFVQQGESDESIIGAEIPELTDAFETLGSESGAEVTAEDYFGSAEAKGIFEAVVKERERYFATNSNNPKGEYVRVKKNLEAAKLELETQQEALRSAEGMIKDLNFEKKRIADYKSLLPEQAATLKERTEDLDKAKEKDNRRKQLQQSITLAEAGVEQAESSLVARRDAAQEVEALGEEKASLEKAFELAKESKEAVEKHIELLSTRRRRTVGLHELAQAKRVWVKSSAEGFAALDALKTEKDTLADVESLHAERSTVETKLDNIHVTQDSVQKMHDAHKDIEIKRATIASLATSVRVESPVGEEIHIDGSARPQTDLSESTQPDAQASEYQVEGATTFAFGAEQQYRLTVTPVSDAESARQDLELAEERLSTLLAEAHVDDVDAAQRQLLTRHDLEAELASLKKQIKKALKKRDLEELRASVSRQEETQHRYEEKTAQALQSFLDKASECSDLKQDELAGDEESGIDYSELFDAPELSAKSVTEELERLDDTIDRLNRQRNLQDTELGDFKGHGAHQNFASAKSALDSVMSRYSAAVALLAEKRETTSDDDLAAALVQAEETLAQAQTVLAQFDADNAEVPALDAAERRWASAKQKLENTRDNLDRSRNASARLEGSLENQRGLPDKVAAAERDFDQAEAAHRKVETAANAANKLYQALSEAREELHRKYQEPFAKAFDHLARLVFPDADFEVDKDLKISSRISDGINLDIDNLSKGAQEQVNLLARLAMASVTAEGAAVPIFIDDALGFADSKRAESMNLVLGELGKTHQVIVMTCEETRFNGIPNSRMEFMTDLRGAALGS